MRFFLTFTAGSVCLCGVCRHVVVYEVFLVPYVVVTVGEVISVVAVGEVISVVAVTVVYVLLVLLDVSMLGECDCEGNVGVGDAGGVVAESAGMSMWVVHVVKVL